MPTSRRGRKIDTIELIHEGVKVKVPIYMRSNDGSVIFYGEVEELGIREFDSNADALYNKLQKAYAEKQRITWMPYLHVAFGGDIRRLIVKKDEDEEENEDAHWNEENGEIRQEARATLKLRIERIWLAIDNEGKPLYCGHHTDDDYKRHVRQGKPPVGEVRIDHFIERGTGGQAALIKDTPENRAALERIIEGMNNLLVGLRDMFRQDQIENTLALVGQNVLQLAAGGTNDSREATEVITEGESGDTNLLSRHGITDRL